MILRIVALYLYAKFHADRARNKNLVPNFEIAVVPRSNAMRTRYIYRCQNSRAESIGNSFTFMTKI